MRFLSFVQSRFVRRAAKPLFAEPFSEEGSALVLDIMSIEIIGYGARKLYVWGKSKACLSGDRRVEGMNSLMWKAVSG
jgi:hypothetical protein